MDDSQTLDDLATLFLSPPGDAPPGLGGPAPVRLRPKPAAGAGAAPPPGDPPPARPGPAAPPPGAAGPAHRLKLAGREVPADPAPRPAASPPLEAVLLGNLPGLASAWLPQYAQLIAHRDGPVLLLHPIQEEDEEDPLGTAPESGVGEGFELEWIGPGGGDAAAVLERLSPEAGLRERVATLLTHATRAPAAVLVNAGVDGPEAAARFAGVADWSLLSGADPVAIEGAAAMLRRLIGVAPAIASAGFGLMVMGSEPPAARDAAGALARALVDDVDSPPEPLGSLPRMNPVARTPLGFVRRGDGPDPWASLLGWLRSLPDAEQAADPEPGPPAASAGSGPDPAEPRTQAPSDPESPAIRGAAAVRSLDLHRRHAAAGDAEDEAPAHPAAPLEGLLERLSTARPSGPRLEAIQPGCPGQPLVQLALDANGRLHLLARHTHSAEHPHPREAMLALRDAAEWAREHQDWLSAAQPHRRVDAADPVPHLVTDRPDLGLSLAKKLGPALRLYLLHGDVCYALTESR
ncbi:hypothetical protein [Phycisphaera mikurensis]|uniref:Uncharacterized protein n=1 Tax=Phycisphaera mikurensis (strain NBRC 102666 / KCTC 22515 / FYK2301M01) TaxID=1142394 RepID=I0IIS2_PHYMF|nr:hypothetical protein [Phycisphaera mikurensis]MBB6442692.1 hypothetical protein [Phycisphaera mikurensis]BAM05160.1 hypothetical protein PSMK_30010 [Phycisphaera mikurensis NBRC 102666]